MKAADRRAGKNTDFVTLFLSVSSIFDVSLPKIIIVKMLTVFSGS